MLSASLAASAPSLTGVSSTHCSSPGDKYGAAVQGGCFFLGGEADTRASPVTADGSKPGEKEAFGVSPDSAFQNMNIKASELWRCFPSPLTLNHFLMEVVLRNRKLRLCVCVDQCTVVYVSA